MDKFAIIVIIILMSEWIRRCKGGNGTRLQKGEAYIDMSDRRIFGVREEDILPRSIEKSVTSDYDFSIFIFLRALLALQ